MSKQNILHKSKKKKAFSFLQNNDLSNAQALYAQVIKSNRNDSEAQFLLGIVYARMGQLQEAEQHMRQAVRIDPKLADAWLNLGQVYELQQQYAASEESLLQSLKLNPAMLEARETLGRVYNSLGRVDEAVEQFRLVVDQAPASASAQSGLALALHLAGRFTEAHHAYKKAITLAPNNVNALVGMGNICRDMRGLEDARRYYQKALQLAPDSIAAILGEAESLEQVGQSQQALELLQPLLPQAENNPVVLILYARICSRLKLDVPIVEMLEKTLNNQALNFRSKERIHYLLGDLYDKQGNYEDAFSHYHSANSAEWQRLGEPKSQDQIDAIITHFESLDFSCLPRANVGEVVPIFIVGMPRSGTSLVEQIMASHPMVYGAGELNDISDIAAELNYNSEVFNPDAESLQAMAQRYLDGMNKRSGGARFVTDKMPQNFSFLGLIALLFPNARIIHIKRDPFDTCLSYYFQNFSSAHTFSFDLKQLGIYYRKYEKLMSYWRRLGIPFLDVQYENLVDDLEGVSRQMTEFCGLDWNDACLHFYENKRVIETASYDQVNKPIYTRSVGRWKNYEEFLAPLKEGLSE